MSSDYGNTIIYKISCNNSEVIDIYVGHTTDFVKRKYAHGKSSMDADYTNKLYTTIREHGGWHNWNMKIIGFFDCKNLTEAREKEQEFFVSLGATLNSIESLPKSKETVEVKPPPRIVGSQIQTDIDIQDSNNKYNCEICSYGCDNKTNFNKHLHTNCHMRKYTEFHQMHDKPVKQHLCKCGKVYKYRQGLHAHKKECIPKNDVHILADMLTESLQSNVNLAMQNQMLQTKVIEIYKNLDTKTNVVL